MYHFYGRSIRNYIFSLFSTFCSISLEVLWESITSASHCDCAAFLWKIYQKRYLTFVFNIVYHFSGRSIRKYNFRFFLGLGTIVLEDLTENKSSVSHCDFVPVLRNIYWKGYLSFIIWIVYHFSGRSIRKYIFRFLLGLCTILLEDISENKSSVSYWDFVPVFCKTDQKGYLSFPIGIVYHFSGRSITNYIFCLFLTLFTISLEYLSGTISLVCFWHSVPFLWKIYQKVYLPFLTAIV